MIRWSLFGAGIVYGRFQWGHFYKVKSALMMQKKEAWEAENQELRDQVKGLETDVYRLRLLPVYTARVDSNLLFSFFKN